MRFLCLHGAIGSITNISIQLAPLEKELERDQTASFRYINAPVAVSPPPGFDEYFGIGPHYRWADDGGTAEDSMLARIRQLPVGESPEDVMRNLQKGHENTTWRNRRQVMDILYRELENDPLIEGIIGYSEGSSVAASFVVDEDRRLEEEGRPRRIRCAIFFTGWPPISKEGKVLLADESDYFINIPTLHVIGANDPYRDGALALYNVCDPDTAVIFDTGKGHTIPRAGLVITELGNAVRELIEVASQQE
ncbi:DUF341 family oxidoreductase, putative [Paecilomyces variotii No. 5]|uniref:DUF341 family oxidoreductase, putative n=1 Tax=Byssochlamys spectabilis (strain No. 5 / NBRC 109023) TaxID=1356009 RepID=V5HYJ9_BYSSN|nr:DUF341 family oxidoreductase, putative [Paecilomyces variotii No. 5]